MNDAYIRQLIRSLTDQDPLLRHVARGLLLGAIGEKTITVSDLVDVMKNPDWYSGDHVLAVASILLEADGGSRKLIDDLFDLFNSTDPESRAVAGKLILAMAWLPGWEVVRGAVMSGLASALDHKNPNIRYMAAHTFRKIGDVSAMRFLLPKLRDPDEYVRYAVMWAMFDLLPAVREIDAVTKEFWLLALSEENDPEDLMDDIPDQVSSTLAELNRQQISGLARITAENFDRVSWTLVSRLIFLCIYYRKLEILAFLVEVFRFSSPDTRSSLLECALFWSQLDKLVIRNGWPDSDHAAIVREAMNDPDPEIRSFVTAVVTLIEQG